jgi:serine/threonine protein phosphatase PrpC
MNTTNKFSISTDSQKGIREKNEDCCCCVTNESGQLLAIVADGIGSLENSELASGAIIDVFSKEFVKYVKIEDIDVFFKETLEMAHTKIVKIDKDVKNGSTLVCCIISGDTIHVFNLGDSRCYQYKNNVKE